MKMIKILAAAAVFMLTAGGYQASAGDLMLTISGAKNDKGRIMVAVGDVHNTSDIIKTAMVEADTKPVEIIVRDLPEGENTLYIFHDENSNYRLDAAPDGTPEEGCYITTVNIKDGVNVMNVKLKYY